MLDDHCLWGTPLHAWLVGSLAICFYFPAKENALVSFFSHSVTSSSFFIVLCPGALQNWLWNPFGILFCCWNSKNFPTYCSTPVPPKQHTFLCYRLKGKLCLFQVFQSPVSDTLNSYSHWSRVQRRIRTVLVQGIKLIAFHVLGVLVKFF